MKTMKKYFKVAICFLAFAVCSFLLAFSPTLTAVSALDYTIQKYELAINSLRMPTTEVDAKNQEFLIPMLDKTVDVATKTIVRVIDPSGVAHDYTVNGDNNDTSYFGEVKNQTIEGTTVAKDYLPVKALNNGVYKIVYIIKTDSNIYYSNTYEVTVKNVSYELDFTDADNSVQLVKSEVKFGTSMTLPVATVKATDTGVVDSTATIDVVVTKNGNVIEANATNSDLVKSAEGVYTLNFTDDSTDDDEPSVYTITYTYNGAINRPTKTFTITAYNEENYNAPSKLTRTSNTKMPTSIELGQTGIELPKLTLKDEYHSDIEYNLTSIVIEKVGSTVRQTLDANTYTFDMTLDKFDGASSYADMKGDYRVTYNIVDAYNNEFHETFIIDDVTVSTKPTVKVAYDYELDSDGKVVGTVDTTAGQVIKNVYGYNEIIVPALYATDLVSTFGDDDFYFVRYIQKEGSSTKYYVDNKYYDVDYTNNEVSEITITNTDSRYNASDDANIGKINKAVSFKFKDSDTNGSKYAGTYILGYEAISKNTEIRVGSLETEYSFKVLADATSGFTFRPTIYIENVKTNSYVKPNDTITVKISSEDNSDTDTGSEYVDKRLQNVVCYYYATTSANNIYTDIDTAIEAISGENDFGVNVLGEAFEAKMVELGYAGFTVVSESDTKNTFSVKIENASGYDELSMVAISLNNTGDFYIDIRVLNISDTNDTVAPEYMVSYDNVDVTADQSKIAFAQSSTDIMPNNIFKQGKEIVLPEVTFNEDNNLEMSVAYYVVKDIENVGKVNYLYPSNIEFTNRSVSGGVITTNEIGIYNVVYTATDVAGNTTVVFFTFEVRDSSSPILTVNADGEGIAQSGNVITIDKGSEISFETLLYSSDFNGNLTDEADFKIKVDNGNGQGYKRAGDTFEFNSVGTYVITFSASYYDSVFAENRSADDKIIIVNVNEVELKWLDETEFDNIVEYAQTGSEVYLPKVKASDDATVSVKVTSPTDTNISVLDVTVDTINQWMFMTNGEEDGKGTYTVTYTAISGESKITKTVKIKVGDNVAPTIKINHEGELKQDIKFNDDITYTFDVDTSKKKMIISAKSNGKTIYEYDLGLIISDKDEFGDVNSNYTWSYLDYTLSTDNGTLEGGELNGSDRVYTITSTGKYTITITSNDSNGNKSVAKKISFNVVKKTADNEVNDTVVGAVLIVVSLVVLAGVILFFTLTGKKSGGSKSKKNKPNKELEKVSESKDEEIIIEDDTNKTE